MTNEPTKIVSLEERQRQRTDAIRQVEDAFEHGRRVLNWMIPLLLALAFAAGVLTGVVIALH